VEEPRVEVDCSVFARCHSGSSYELFHLDPLLGWRRRRIEQDLGSENVFGVDSGPVVRRRVDEAPWRCRSWHSADDWEQKGPQTCLEYAISCMGILGRPSLEIGEVET